MNFRIRVASASAIFVAILVCGFASSECHAQKKYKDPYDKTVRRIADDAAHWLKNNPQGILDRRSICALAVLEYHKRYDEAIPTDVALINDCVSEIATAVDNNSASVLDHRETYFPAVALILLAEFDAAKYKPQIEKILESIIARQLDTGAYGYKGQRGNDTSQSQFAALALYVARQHRFSMDPEVVKKLLQFYVDFQADDGSWKYQASLNDTTGKGSNSIHSASLSSVYLLADLLKLSRRVKKMSLGSSVESELGLPKNVSVYIPPANADDAVLEAAWDPGPGRPIVKFDRGRLQQCKSAGNSWYQARFRFPIEEWNSYFMYALERYAWFKEQADGNLGSALSSWYDDGVDYIAEYQDEDGSIVGHRRVPTMPLTVNTALSVLFLVRASEVISLPPVGSDLGGDVGFDSGTLTQSSNGTIAASGAEKSLSELVAALQDDSLDDRQLAQLTEAMKRAIREFKKAGNKSRGEITAFLKTMISDRNYYRRLVAIKFLSGEQDLDNVPALLYAMGDPDTRIAVEAHNGLRLISRKFDTFKYEDQGNKDDNLLQLTRLKQQWTRWYLEIRPDAELLE